MVAITGFCIRLYPTKEQEKMMIKHINCARYIWNYMLELQQARYKNGEKHLSRFDMIKTLTTLKNDGEHKWLRDVLSATLQSVCGDLSAAYRSFFNKSAGYPKFKSKKKSKQSYPLRSDGMYFSKKKVYINKIGAVKYKSDMTFRDGRNNRYLNPRVKYEFGMWMLSFCEERDNQALTLTANKMGIDLGVKELATVAYGSEKYVFGNINKSNKVRNIKARLKFLQRSSSRKYEANKVGCKYIKTKNIVRQEIKISKLHRRLSNIRKNYIHQITARLTKQMRPSRVVMEKLNVKGMIKNHRLAESIQDQCFYEFARQMKYKCWRSDIEFMQADRFYPSSKTCSNCGFVNSRLRLTDRLYVCPNCGFEIDRDYNAAINLQRYGA